MPLRLSNVWKAALSSRLSLHPTNTESIFVPDIVLAAPYTGSVKRLACDYKVRERSYKTPSTNNIAHFLGRVKRFQISEPGEYGEIRERAIAIMQQMTMEFRWRTQ